MFLMWVQALDWVSKNFHAFDSWNPLVGVEINILIEW